MFCREKKKSFKIIISCVAGILVILFANWSITLDTIYNIRINIGEIFPVLIALAWETPYALIAGVCGGMWDSFLMARANGCVNILYAFLYLCMLMLLGFHKKEADETGVNFSFIPIMIIYSFIYFFVMNYGTNLFVRINYHISKYVPFYISKGVSPIVTRIKAINSILFFWVYIILSKILLLFNLFRSFFGLKKLRFEKYKWCILGVGVAAFASLVVIDSVLDSFYMTARGFRVSIFMRSTGELSRLSIFIIILGFIIYLSMYSFVKMKLTHEEQLESEAAYSVQIKKLNDNLQQIVDQRTEELKTAYNELETYSYTVSHELKTPIREIDAYIGIIAEDTEDLITKETKNDLQDVQQICKDTIKMVESMMQYAKVGYSVMNIEEIDMRRLISECVEELRTGNVTKKIQIHMLHIFPIYGDRFLMKQAIFNILSNSVKFSQGNVEITVGGITDGNQITYYFKDNGVGFNQEEGSGKKVFELFDRMHTRQEYEGSGVGLATVKKIIERHGGNAQIFSKAGGGCVVVLTFDVGTVILRDKT